MVRLVGLYHSSRGAHTAFLKMGQVARPGSYLVNLIHYEDAASIAVSALSHRGPDGVPLRGELLLGADGVPVTFRDMMDAVAKSGRFEGGVEFTEADEPQQGKRVGNGGCRVAMGWRFWNAACVVGVRVCLYVQGKCEVCVFVFSAEMAGCGV